MARRVLAFVIVAYILALHGAVAWLVWRYDPAFLGEWRHAGLDLDRRAFWRAQGTLERVDTLLQRSPIVLLGDSLIEEFPADLAPPDALNLGLGGFGINQLIKTLGRYPSLAHAKAIVVEIGINDLCRGDSDTAALAARNDALLAALPKQVPIIWTAIFPIEPKVAADKCRATPDAIAAANRTIARTCAAAANCRFSGMAGLFATEAGTMNAELHRDGLHLNRRGYEVWGRQLRAELAGGGAPR